MIHSKNPGISLLKIITAFLILIGIGCKNTETTKPSNAKISTASAADEEALERMYWSRVDSARMSFTQADVKFMNGMIAHHAQALIMSRLAPENGASSDVQTLTARIINSQKDEISTMQKWLRNRGLPAPKIEIDGLNLSVSIDGKPFTSYKKMRGVLAQEKLVELSEAQGSEYDRLFLKYMIEHHSGAVYMVEKLFSTDGAAQDEEAFRLASNIQVDQRTEIERMRLMLNRLIGIH